MEKLEDRLRKVFECIYGWKILGIRLNEKLSTEDIVYFDCPEKIDIDPSNDKEFSELNHLQYESSDLIKLFKKDFIKYIIFSNKENITDEEIEEFLKDDIIEFRCNIIEGLCWTFEDFKKAKEQVQKELEEASNKIKEYEEQQNKYKNV